MDEPTDSVALGRARRNVPRVTYSDMPIVIKESHTRRTTTPRNNINNKKSVTTTTTMKREHKLAPARTIHGFLDIEAHFRRRIRDQDTAIQHIAASLSRALSSIAERDTYTQETNDDIETSIYTMTLCGPSGCGKTETVLALKNFFGMDTGYEYENQYIELDGSTYGESMQINSVTGGGAGLVGYQDGNSLSERLLKAIADYQKNLGDDDQQPPYLMLFIDEIDKADPGFLRNLNGLLGAGKYVSPSGNSFYLPRGVLLFVVLTANYGAHAIGEMSMRNDDLAQEYIKEEMRAHHMQDYTIGRLGQILPYYPIKREVLYALMVEKLDAFIARSPMAKAHGVKNILYKEEVKERLVNSVLDKMDNNCGIRGGLEQLFKKLNLLFEISFAKLNTMIRTKECPVILDQSIHIDTHSFDIKELFRKEIKQILHKDIIDTIHEIPANKQCIEQCPSDHDGVVNAVGMRYGDKQLCNLIMGFNFHTIINNYGNAETTIITQSLQEKLKRAKRKERIMRGCLAELSDATRKKTTIKAIKTIIERNQALLSESLSDESDDHEQPVMKPRKRTAPKNIHHQQPIKKKRKVEPIIPDETPQQMILVPRDDVTIEEVTFSDEDGEYSVFNDEEIAAIFDLARKEADEEAAAKKREEDLSFIEEVTPLNSSYEEDSNDSEVMLYDNIIRENLRRVCGGRPPREYEGFRRVKTKRSTAILECHGCKKRINSRYAKNHKCVYVEKKIYK